MFCRELEVPSPETALNELPNSWIICYLQETAAQDCFLGLSNLLHPCSDGKESACNAGDLGSILGSGRSPGVGSGNPLQYSFLENLMDRGAWRATVHRVAKSWMKLKQLSMNECTLKNRFSLYMKQPSVGRRCI